LRRTRPLGRPKLRWRTGVPPRAWRRPTVPAEGAVPGSVGSSPDRWRRISAGESPSSAIRWRYLATNVAGRGAGGPIGPDRDLGANLEQADIEVILGIAEGHHGPGVEGRLPPSSRGPSSG
jgi:hypothetical protein